MTTTIAISDDVWKELNSRKETGQSFEGVLRQLLNLPIKPSQSLKSRTGLFDKGDDY